MLSGFMLPSFGAFTLDGTIFLAVGVIAIIGVLYKYKENISLTNTENLINVEENTTSNIKFEKNEVKTDNLEVNSEEVEEDIVVNEEKVKIFN